MPKSVAAGEGIEIEFDGTSTNEQVFDRAERSPRVKPGKAGSKKSADAPAPDVIRTAHIRAFSFPRYCFPYDGNQYAVVSGQAVPIWDMQPWRRTAHAEVTAHIRSLALVFADDDRMVLSPTAPSKFASYTQALKSLDSGAGALDARMGNVGGIWTWRPDRFPVGGVATAANSISRTGKPVKEWQGCSVRTAATIASQFESAVGNAEFVWLVDDDDGELEMFNVLTQQRQRFTELPTVPLALSIANLPEDYGFRSRQELTMLVGERDVFLAVRNAAGSEGVTDYRLTAEQFSKSAPLHGMEPVARTLQWVSMEDFYTRVFQEDAESRALRFANVDAEVV